MNLKTIINSFDLAIKLNKDIFIVVDGVMYIGTPSKKKIKKMIIIKI
ncbi:hypothetical protein [Staphylococcus capitis]